MPITPSGGSIFHADLQRLSRIEALIEGRCMTAVPNGTIRFWHFQCPECGTSDQEFRHLAEAHDVHCEVCLADNGRTVMLRRWPADDSALVERQAPYATAAIPAERDRLVG